MKDAPDSSEAISGRPHPLALVFIRTLAFVIGGIGSVGLYLGPEFWHLAVGGLLVAASAILFRVGKNGG